MQRHHLRLQVSAEKTAGLVPRGVCGMHSWRLPGWGSAAWACRPPKECPCNNCNNGIQAFAHMESGFAVARTSLGTPPAATTGTCATVVRRGRPGNVLFSLNLELQPGELVLVKGEAQCGRSTLVHLLHLDIAASGGSLQFQTRAGNWVGFHPTSTDRYEMQQRMGFVSPAACAVFFATVLVREAFRVKRFRVSSLNPTPCLWSLQLYPCSLRRCADAWSGRQAGGLQG